MRQDNEAGYGRRRVTPSNSGLNDRASSRALSLEETLDAFRLRWRQELGIGMRPRQATDVNAPAQQRATSRSAEVDTVPLNAAEASHAAASLTGSQERLVEVDQIF